ncbi:hypothetical protein ACWXWU_08395 [Shewanella sp. A14]
MMIFTRFVLITSFLAINFFATSTHSQALPSLEHVTGFGMDTHGGEYGSIIKVTNTNNQGEGSLRWAISQAGKRLVVFEVGGVIDLQKQTLTIDTPYLTIAGETAPHPGITLIRGGIKIISHDIRIRHLAVRPGDNNEATRSGWAPDAIGASGRSAYNIHIDHCSATWAVDENMSASGPRDKGHEFTAKKITFSNSIIAQALDNATHKKGKHSKGLLIHDFIKNIAIIGNLFAHNDRRNPYFKGSSSGVVVNNLMYNLGNAAVQLGFVNDEFAHSDFEPDNPKVTVIGNKLIYGNSSYSDLPLVAYQGNVFMQDNQVINLDGEPMPQAHGAMNQLSAPPLWPNGLVAISVKTLEDRILAQVGARPWDRDPIDQRIINSVKQRGGNIIDSQNEVGGYPNYATTHRSLTVPDNNQNTEAIRQWLLTFTKVTEHVSP